MQNMQLKFLFLNLRKINLIPISEAAAIKIIYFIFML